MRLRGWTLWIGSALLVTGVIALSWYAWVWHEASVMQSQAKQWLEERRLAHAPAPRFAIHKPRRGQILAELEIPRLGISVVVLEGDDADILKVGAGHIPGTGLPQTGGNIGIAAHRDTFFRPLRFIRRADVIALKTPEGISRFQVRDVEVVPPSDTGILAATQGRDLTLVTCYPFFYIGSAPERFIVHAERLPA